LVASFGWIWVVGFISEAERNKLRVESEGRFLLQWLLPVKGGLTVFSSPHCSGLPH